MCLGIVRLENSLIRFAYLGIGPGLVVKPEKSLQLSLNRKVVTYDSRATNRFDSCLPHVNKRTENGKSPLPRVLFCGKWQHKDGRYRIMGPYRNKQSALNRKPDDFGGWRFRGIYGTDVKWTFISTAELQEIISEATNDI